MKDYSALAGHLIDIAPIVKYNENFTFHASLDRRFPNLYELDTLFEVNKQLTYIIDNFFDNGMKEFNREFAFDYFIYKWFNYKCSEVDQHFFREHSDSKLFIEGFSFVSDFSYAYSNPLRLIDYLYKQNRLDFLRSRRLQNRLFLVYESKISLHNERLLRARFQPKIEVFMKYNENKERPLFDYLYGRKSDVIYIVENEDKSLSYGIASDNKGGEVDLIKL